MIILIDNYDSFTFNLVHYLGALGADVVVHRNDKISVDDVMAKLPFQVERVQTDIQAGWCPEGPRIVRPAV